MFGSKEIKCVWKSKTKDLSFTLELILSKYSRRSKSSSIRNSSKWWKFYKPYININFFTEPLITKTFKMCPWMVLCVLYNSPIDIDPSCCKHTLYPLNPNVKNYSIRHNLETGPVKRQSQIIYFYSSVLIYGSKFKYPSLQKMNNKFNI